MAVLAPGPRSADRARTKVPLELATIFVDEARQTGDSGFYTLADDALSCALERDPGDRDATRLRAHVHLQFHRFAEVEQAMAAVVAQDPGWLDEALYGDALMEQGKLDAAADAYQAAMGKRPNAELYDRVSWLRWLWGDAKGALELEELAVSSSTPADPEPYCFYLTRLGWLHALQGRPAPELEVALRLLPDYPQAHFARGRIALAKGLDATADLRKVPESFEAKRALALQDPGVDLAPLEAMDRRGWAIWQSDHDAAAALTALTAELGERQDAMTHLAHAYAVARTGGDGTAEARAALATGILEPRALYLGGLVLHDSPTLLRALATGPGLLPDERERALAGLQAGP